jgi:pyroglutamyl-peptidase
MILSMKILISGFHRFGEHHHNPTAILIEALQEKKIAIPPNVSITGIILPVTFKNSFNQLQKKIEEIDPEFIIALGLAATRESIDIERIAINCMDASIPDNDQFLPKDESIDLNGQEAFFSTLPIREIEMALKQIEIKTTISNSAGTFVCNYLFYQLMKHYPQKKCGFIHVPDFSKISQELQMRALEEILVSLAKTNS